MPAITLTPETLEQINQALDVAKALKEEIKRAQQAGIDVGIKLEDVEAQEAQLRAIKQTYFPQGRRAS